jgi:hypothetical protein
MSPQQIMRRWQRSLLGVTCIAGGCAALVWMLGQGQVWLPQFESSAQAAEGDAATGSGPSAEAELPQTKDAAVPNVPQKGVVSDINAKALINDVKPAEAELAPKPAVHYLAPRPNWVEADFSQEKGDVQKIAVSSGPYKRKHDAQRALNEELERVTRNFVSDYLGNKAAGTLVPVDLQTIRNELVLPGNTFEEQLEVSDLGPMYQSHALVSFTPSFRQQIDERWHKIVVAGRTAKLGVIAVGVLMALSVVCGYFKADNATRGYYSTRLQLGSAGAILALVAAGFWVFTRLM